MEVGRSETAANPIIISLIVNWSTLILHSEQAAAGGGGDCKQCRYTKWKRVSKMKWKGEVKNCIFIDTGILILAGFLQAGSEGEWSGREG